MEVKEGESGLEPSTCRVTKGAVDLQTAIDRANKATLCPKQALHARGAAWWNNECSVAYGVLRHTTPDRARKRAVVELHGAVCRAKWEWAYEMLHHTVDVGNVWHIALI